ncbi:MAG TPA: sugar porter family MFS transporter [Microbacteriaceae bacterium]|nr:sugar porter family MFS transporter [Microbacteriaceae bacterium]
MPKKTVTSTVNARVIGLAIAGAVGGFLFGFDSSVVNGAVDAIQEDFGLDPTITGLAIASALVGCAVGAELAGRLADRLGRVPVMLIGAILFLVSSIGSGLAFGVWDLVAWRLIGGLGIGIASVVAPAYIAEISPSRVRGRFASLQQLAIVLGIFAALLSDALFANAAGGAQGILWFGLDAWRWMFLACAVPAIVYGLIALTLPESPRYLIRVGKEDRARAVLATIIPAEDVDASVADVHASIERDAGQKGSLRGKALGLKPIVWVGILLSVFQQFVGINVIFYYSTTLWRAVGFTEQDSLTISVITSVTNIVVTIIAIMLVDKVGRRPLLIWGSAGMTIALATMSIAFSQAIPGEGGPTLPDAWGPIALVAANLFVVAFAISWGPIVWVLLGEIFPNPIRARALGLAAAAQWAANFLITVTFPGLAAFSLTFAYGMYAVFAILSLVFVVLRIPETKGTKLDDADKLQAPARRRKAPVTAG